MASFWNKLGKIALTAAPYVAAPFTGGASLMATGLANKAVGAWNERDARKQAEKGLGPSSFDRYIGMAGDVAGMASGAGAMGKFGAGQYGGTSSGTSWQDKLRGVLDQDYRTPPYVPEDQGGSYKSTRQYGGDGNTDYISRDIGDVAKSGRSKGGVSGFIDKLGGAKGIGAIAGGVGGAFALKKILDRDNAPNISDNAPVDYGTGPNPREMGTSRFQQRMRRELGPVMGQANQNNPNLALSIGQGRMDAMRDQPFRGGYDVRHVEDYDPDTGDPIYSYTPMPRIGPGRRRRQAEYYGGGGRPE